MKALKYIIIFIFIINAVFAQCISTIGAGSYHGLALKPNGTIYSWGNGAYGSNACGQDNFNSDVLNVTQIGTLNTWSKINAGPLSSFVIKNDQTLWVCGGNERGELGNGTFGQGNVTVVLTQIGTASWKMVSGNFNFTLGLKTNGTIWATGANYSGQLGDGTNTNRSVFTQIGTANNWKEIDTGQKNGYGIKQDGTLWSWGFNGGGQLGNDDLSVQSRNIPEQVGTDNDWSKICGESEAKAMLVLKNNGGLYSFGNMSVGGSIGFGVGINKVVPSQIGTTNDWVTASCGKFCSFGIKTNGTLWGWGLNDYGQLGDGTTTSQGFPVQVGTDTNWATVVSGGQNVVATKTDGSLWTWGNGSLGQLGNGGYNNVLVPTQIAVPDCLLNNNDFAVNNDGLNIAPNPATNSTTISFSNATTAPLLEIYNVLGKLVTSYQATNNTESWSLDTSKLASGLYIVALRENGVIVMQKKLIVN